jgi:hypothetical protein
MVFHYIFKKETCPNHHIEVLFTPNLIWQIIAWSSEMDCWSLQIFYFWLCSEFVCQSLFQIVSIQRQSVMTSKMEARSNQHPPAQHAGWMKCEQGTLFSLYSSLIVNHLPQLTMVVSYLPNIHMHLPT